MPEQKPSNDLLKYSSIGIQLMAIILICTFGGKWIDRKVGNEKQIFMLIGAILGVIFAMVYMIRETGRINKNRK